MAGGSGDGDAGVLVIRIRDANGFSSTIVAALSEGSIGDGPTNGSRGAWGDTSAQLDGRMTTVMRPFASLANILTLSHGLTRLHVGQMMHSYRVVALLRRAASDVITRRCMHTSAQLAPLFVPRRCRVRPCGLRTGENCAKVDASP